MLSTVAKKEEKLLDSPIIDAYNHFYPRQYLDGIGSINDPFLENSIKVSKAFTDLETRIRVMDRLGIDIQVLTLGHPTLDDSGKPPSSLSRLARIANDGLANAIERHRERFVAVATVSLQNVGEAIDEVDRCVRDLGVAGIQVLTNVVGRPLDLQEFESFYDRICHHDTTLFVHPTHMRKTYDWLYEFGLMTTLGWDAENSFAMYRLVRSGVFVRHPDLKILVHHMGSFTPFLIGRIERSWLLIQGKNGYPPEPLTKKPSEYFKMFYADTGEGAWHPALECAQSFFGSRHLIFASDYPMHEELDLSNTLESVKQLDVSDEEKRMILGENAMRLLKIRR